MKQSKNKGIAKRILPAQNLYFEYVSRFKPLINFKEAYLPALKNRG
jgi:hypothetical protein